MMWPPEPSFTATRAAISLPSELEVSSTPAAPGDRANCACPPRRSHGRPGPGSQPSVSPHAQTNFCAARNSACFVPPSSVTTAMIPLNDGCRGSLIWSVTPRWSAARPRWSRTRRRRNAGTSPCRRRRPFPRRIRPAPRPAATQHRRDDRNVAVGGRHPRDHQIDIADPPDRGRPAPICKAFLAASAAPAGPIVSATTSSASPASAILSASSNSVPRATIFMAG